MAALTINGKSVEVDVDPDMPLLWALRDHLSMTGTKYGCGMALCGACTVHIDGQPSRSCSIPVSAVEGKHVLRPSKPSVKTGSVRPCRKPGLPRTWPSAGDRQSGQIMSATALLTSNKSPTDADIDAAMAGNICRCATYPRIRAAIKRAAGSLA